MSQEELRFSVDSRLLGELGERLVTKNYIALSELIKNAYDADATKITIRFINAKKEKPEVSQIHLEDDGQGMTFQEVRDYWMRIATPIKIREPVSPIFGRRKTGSKGIGRFACRRLAKFLSIETIAKVPNSNELEWTKVDFDWEKFKPGTTLTEILCDYQTKRLTEGKTGTILKLKELNEKWTDRDFNILKRQILMLSVTKGTRREGFKEDPGFDISLDAPEFPEGTGLLVDKFMDAGWGKLEGRTEEDGTVKLVLNAKGIRKKSYTLPKKFSKIIDVNFEIAIIFLDKKYFRNPKILTKTLGSEILEQGGIRVYLDGFRIYPYGDPGEDWLDIEKDKARSWGMVDSILTKFAEDLGQDPSRAMLSHPRYRNLIGKVYISSSEKIQFEVKTDREGFIENEAYIQLKRALRLALQWATLQYKKFRMLQEEKELREAEKRVRENFREIIEEEKGLIGLSVVEQALEVISKETKRSVEALPKREKVEAEERLKTVTEVIKISISRSEAYSSILSAVASSGVYMMAFTHEIRTLTAKLGTYANTIDRLWEVIPPEHRKDFEEFGKSLRSTRDRLENLIDLFGELGKITTDQEKKPILVKKEAIDIFQGFQYLIDYYGIDETKIEISDDLRTGPMLRAEFFSILVNLISNAVKAVIAGRGNKILIRGSKEDRKTVIRVYNDGVKLQKEYWEDVFEPLVFDPEEKIYSGLIERIKDEDIAILGRGSGLGLTIVREMVRKYDGEALFIDVEDPWKTGIEVTLP